MLERSPDMSVLDLIKSRRSIRRYLPQQIPKEHLDIILEAGAYAPSAGGGQRTKIVGVHDADLTTRIGRLNHAQFNRSSLAGAYVSDDQPSIIDDTRITNAFYDAPCVCVLFGPEHFLYSIPDAYCCAENMILMAAELGISSCIIARAEETFHTEYGRGLQASWNIPDQYTARCFVILGYIDGPNPAAKPRQPNRMQVVHGGETNGCKNMPSEA